MNRLVIPSIVASGSGVGVGKTQTLLSITTAPSGTFTKGSQYYNSTTKKIYTATEDNTWTDAKESNPLFGVYYQFDTHTYVWDGNSLEIFELEDYQKTEDRTNNYNSDSTTKYPSSKALYDGLATKQNSLPSQTGNSGKSLMTNGTDLSWQNVQQVQEQNDNELIKFWYGTQNEYDDLESYDTNTNYIITDDSQTISTLLATQQQFDSSAQDKAATPYQVNNKLTEYTEIPAEVTDLVSTTITLPQAEANTVYRYGTLTSLTISSNETSDLETTIYFTAGSTITVNLPQTLKTIGNIDFYSNTSYVLSIQNNILVVGEINN